MRFASRSRVSLPSVKRPELGKGAIEARAGTVKKLQRALGSGGLEFTAENGGSPGVRLKGGSGSGRTFTPRANL
jgi:hypothetical protein